MRNDERANIERDRAAFRALLVEAERLLANGDTDGSHSMSEAAAAIASRWRSKLLDLLQPLLDDEQPPYVRFGAASSLLPRGYADVAVATLEDIRDNTACATSASARRLLAFWRRHNSA